MSGTKNTCINKNRKIPCVKWFESEREMQESWFVVVAGGISDQPRRNSAKHSRNSDALSQYLSINYLLLVAVVSQEFQQKSLQNIKSYVPQITQGIGSPDIRRVTADLVVMEFYQICDSFYLFSLN